MPASPSAREHSGAVSGPVSMQPSGPVPTLAAVAAGSGPHNDTSARPPFSAPVTLADAQRAWNDVLSELENLRKFSLLGPFQHARVMSWTADQLELGFPVDAHAMGEMAMDNADELRAILRARDPALKNLKLVVRTLDASESKAAGTRSILEADRERTSAERTKREAEAREHPITKHVLRTFGAQIKEIKTDV